MIAVWHPVVHGPAVRSAMEATAPRANAPRGASRLDEPGWRWCRRVRPRSRPGRRVAADAHAAERAAEEELYRAHPPIGDAADWWLDE